MCPACYQDGGSLLHCLSTLTMETMAVYFCCTSLGVTSTGRYPASCPAKPGLSSSELFRLSSRDHLACLRKCYFNIIMLSCKEKIYFYLFKNQQPDGIYCFYQVLKQLPPINSRRRELFGTSSLGTGTK